MPTLYDLALMAEDIYSIDESGIYAASFPEPAPPGLPDRVSLTRTLDVCDAGFAAALYKTQDSVTITYRGTDTSSDAGLSDQQDKDALPQFARAVAFAEDAIDQCGLTPAKTYLCGHSMGGTLAEYVAYHLEQKGWSPAAAVLFNAPSLNASIWDKALVAGLSQLTDEYPVGVGISAVHEMMQDADLPQSDPSGARLISVSLDGDVVSKIGDVSGISFALTAPDFVRPPGFELHGAPDLPDSDYAQTLVLREAYLHSMHTLRRVLADDPLGQREMDSFFTASPS